MDKADPFPGGSATAAQLLELARQYENAAALLEPSAKAGVLSSTAPYRLLIIHAIELYLNALMLHEGVKPCEVRAMQHDLAIRVERAAELGLGLKRRTERHLATLTQKREYLLARYAPGTGAPLSPASQLKASVKDIGQKVSSKLTASG